MSGFLHFFGSTAIFSLLLLPHLCMGEPSATKRRQADALVCEALNQSLYGLEREREQLLRRALQLNPDCDAARWQSGFVKAKEGWKRFDDICETPLQQRRRESYEDRRATMPDTVEGQLALANWCLDVNLPWQERAHLNRVIQLAPNHAEARERLGYVSINGGWRLRQDFWQGMQESQEATEASQQWTPRLASFAETFRDGNPRQCEVALQRLTQMVSPDAIPALETSLAADSQAAGLAVVQVLGGMLQRDASLALVRLSVLSPFPTVREQAAKQLADRPMDHYVPALLAELSTPIQSQMQTDLVNGQIRYRHAFARETKDAQKMTVMDAVLERRPSLVLTTNSNGRVSGDDAADAIRNSQAAMATRAMGDVRNVAMGREQMRLRQNAQILNWNDRICLSLNLATGQDLPPSPEAWWAWWDEQNEITLDGDKTPEIQYALAYRQYEDLTDTLVTGDRGTTTGTPRRRCECFVAGTLVWTIAGPVPIESIQVGDMVLSQHPETGELTYKPVLQTTIRPPERLIKMTLCTIDRETLEASSGHPLWVAGQGWVLFRDIRSGMVLHTVDGTVRVSDVQEGSFQQTYNLIVADYQTYVVGMHRLLCHDNTDRRPTDAIVPGLLQQ